MYFCTMVRGSSLPFEYYKLNICYRNGVLCVGRIDTFLLNYAKRPFVRVLLMLNALHLCLSVISVSHFDTAILLRVTACYFG